LATTKKTNKHEAIETQAPHTIGDEHKLEAKGDFAEEVDVDCERMVGKW